VRDSPGPVRGRLTAFVLRHRLAWELLAGVLVFVGLGLPGFASSRLALMWLRSERETAHLEREIQELRREVSRLADRLDSGPARPGHPR
jgi:hypothetical protein